MNKIAKTHHAKAAWAQVMAQIRAAAKERRVHPSQIVVLLPYAQLIQEARQAWIGPPDFSGVQGASTSFLPRFESTMNWVRGLGGFAPTGDDLRLDAAFDAITARSLLQRAGLADHSASLAQRLMEAAWSLAGVAAARPPTHRRAWADHTAQTLFEGLGEPVFAFEAALGRIALAWAGTSAYASDVLWLAEPALLVVVDGFQGEPLLDALAERLGPRCLRLALPCAPGLGAAHLHATADFEDEAELAAACVLRHLVQSADPAETVALVALDRQLTRRVRALLGEQGVAIRDETGWKLSTTRSGATLITLLRASHWDASTDEVLDWLKNAPAFSTQASALAALERELRQLGLRQWPTDSARLARSGEPGRQIVERANTLRTSLQGARALRQWLADLCVALFSVGQWQPLMEDAAGRAALEALGLRANLEGAVAEDPGYEQNDFPGYAMRLTAIEFTAWASQTLESANFSAPHPTQAQVVILPLSQLLGRSLNRVVLAGCDETHLPVSPEPPGSWTPAQRLALGLPTRSELAAALRKSWENALGSPQVDVVWRTSEGAERALPSGFVQELLQLQKSQISQGLAPDPRATREVDVNPVSMPRPSSEALPVVRLSASAYEDLRRCPYRFFALRQLQLAADDELDTEVDKRDFGNWVHRVLFHFQSALTLTPTDDRDCQTTLIDSAARQATLDLGLSAAEFLPFAASWPRVRAGYLDWLAGQVGAGNQFVSAEVWKEIRLGAVTLVGKLDRIDRQPDGKLLVIDYKTESRALTVERIKKGNEDTQLAFYAALIDTNQVDNTPGNPENDNETDAIAAAYVNVGEKDGSESFPQPNIVALRAQLAEGILEDMQGIRNAKPMPAMGEGFACEFCAARGLCRKDFWA